MNNLENKKIVFKPHPLVVAIAYVMGMVLPQTVNGAVPNDLNIYKPAAQGKKNLIMMVDSSAGMDDEQSGKPARSIKEDYPECANKNLGGIGTDVLDFVYQGENTLNVGGSPKGTFVYRMPYCNPNGAAVEIRGYAIAGEVCTTDRYRRETCGPSNNYWVSNINNTRYQTLTQLKAAPTNVQEEFRQYIRGMKYSRMDRMKVAMTDLLSSNVISNNVVMGTGNFSSQTSKITFDANKTAEQNQPGQLRPSTYYTDTGVGLGSGLGTNAKILVPAGVMDAIQRWKMRVSITSLSSGARTPLSSALAESGAYMLGTTTKKSNNTHVVEPITNRNASGFDDSTDTAKDPSQSNRKYKSPISSATVSDSCDANGIFLLTNGAPTAVPATTATELFTNAYGATVPTATARGIQQVGSGNTDFGWLKMGNFAAALNNSKNIKTAIAGFGNNFVAYMDPAANFYETLTDANGNSRIYYKCDALVPYIGQEYTVRGGSYAGIKTRITRDTINACHLGEKAHSSLSGVGGYGEGGFYPIVDPEDLIDSVEKFVSELELTLPSISAGIPAIPVDTLNVTQQLPYAYYSQFQPKIESTQSIGIWLGNLKKYSVSDNTYKDKNSNNVVNSDGLLNSTRDYWNTGAADGADATKGGALAKLPVQTEVGRKIYSDRVVSGSTVSAITDSDTALMLIPSNNTSGTTNNAESLRMSSDPDRAYLLNLLGFGISAPTPPANLTNAAQLRQMGATLNSTPLFFTTQSKIATRASGSGETRVNIGDYISRKDYVLFGTNQGLIQVVNADSGEEKFAFLPQEMIDRQKNGFVDKSLQTSTNVGDHLYQGIDGAWSVYANYVANSESNSLKASTLNVYGGMRRGGYNYYALDLKDIETSSPKFLFKVGPQQSISTTGVVSLTGTCSNTAPLDCMGQSWSKPTIAWIKWKGKPQLVMIVGGGYDPVYDSVTYKSNTTATKGNGVYIFAAEQAKTATGSIDTTMPAAGTLLWWGSSSATDAVANNSNDTRKTNNSNLKYSVVSEIKAIDRDSDGFVDNLYFGDLGGQVFRVDIDNSSSGTVGTATKNIVVKRIQRIANFISDTDRANKAAPRFYHMPTFTVHNVGASTRSATGVEVPYTLSNMRGAATRFAVITIGSGDVSNPIESTLTSSTGLPDHIYAIFDKDVGRKDLYTNTNDNDTTGENATRDGLLTKDISITNMISLAGTGTNAPTIANMIASSSHGWYHSLTGALGRTGTDNVETSQSIARYKILSGFGAIKNTLFASYFDSADRGSSTSCSAGVKGRSYIKNYCLPFGNMGADGNNCGTSTDGRSYSTVNGGIGNDVGAGIVPVVVGGMANNTIGPITGKGQSSGVTAQYSIPLRFEPMKWLAKRS